MSFLTDVTSAIGVPAPSDPALVGPNGDGFRFEFPQSTGKGGYDIVPINTNMVLIMGDFVAHETSLDVNPGKNVVKLHFQIQGRSAYDLCGERSFQVSDMTAGLLFHPEGMKKQTHFPEMERQLGVTLCLTLDFIRDMLGESQRCLPELVRSSLYGNVMDYLYLGFPVNHEMALAAQSLLNYRQGSEMRKLKLQAKSYEVLYQFFKRLEDLERSGNGHSRITASDREKAEQAKLYLERNYVEPPTLIEIAHRLGTNEAKLANTFKIEFDCTIFEYLQKVRMENARTLLRQSDISITQIAMDVGYQYPGNFTTAFKRHFGVTPRAFRQT